MLYPADLGKTRDNRREKSYSFSAFTELKEAPDQAEMIEKLAETTGFEKSKVNEVVKALFDTAPRKGIIAIALEEGDKVTIPGFGTFTTANRKAEIGRNPRTGAEIRIPGRTVTVPVFRAGEGLKERV